SRKIAHSDTSLGHRHVVLTLETPVGQGPGNHDLVGDDRRQNLDRGQRLETLPQVDFHREPVGGIREGNLARTQWRAGRGRNRQPVRRKGVYVHGTRAKIKLVEPHHGAATKEAVLVVGDVRVDFPARQVLQYGPRGRPEVPIEGHEYLVVR